MNAIKQYDGSSNESSSSEEDCVDGNEESSKSDFFNLDESDNDKTLTGEKKINFKTYKDAHGKTVEIPNTDFWHTVTTDFIQMHATDYVPKENVRCLIPPSPSSSSSSSVDFKWTRYNQNVDRSISTSYEISHTQKRCQNETRNKKEHIKRTKYFTSDLNPTKLVPDTVNTLENERKLFFVHSKIKTHLSGPKASKRVSNYLEKNVKGHAGPVNRVKWNISQFSHLMLSVSMDTNVKVWNFWTDLDFCVKTIRCHNKAVKDADWSICGKKIVSCSYDKTAALTDVETGYFLFILFNFHSLGIHCMYVYIYHTSA